MGANTCTVLLVKYPEKGKVKSRLLRQIDENFVVELYRNFVLDIVDMLDTSGISQIIAYSPKSAVKKFEKWLGLGRNYLPQRGNNLGHVLKNACIDTYSLGFKRVIVIASDCPDLPEEILQEAIVALQDYSAVIGPSPDGGYYLIGFTQEAFSAKTFQAITWSTDKVFTETISKLRDQRQQVYILPEWSDVDNLVDLIDLFKRNQNSRFNSSKTIGVLKSNLDYILRQLNNEPSRARMHREE